MSDNNELDALIHFWRDSLAEHRLLMSPAAIYMAEQTIRSLETLANLTASGLFVTTLNNGEWMAGKANYIYQMDITQDHHADLNLVIANTLPQVLSAARAKFSGGQNHEH